MSERRYTKNQARAIIACRLAVLILTLPFLLALQAVSPDTVKQLPAGKPIRLVSGEFYL